MNRERDPRMVVGLLALVVALVIAACTAPPPPPSSTHARLNGAITVGVGLAAGTGTPIGQRPDVGAAALDGLLADWQIDESLLDFVPGDLIVRFASRGWPTLDGAPAGDGVSSAGAAAQVVGSVQAAGLAFAHQRALSDTAAQLFRAGGVPSHAQTLAAARELNARDDVIYAHPNYILHALAVPDDPGYDLQWHYPAINLPAAWDISTGSSSTVVAVLDTGILYSTNDVAARHPDLSSGRILPGYDFISSPSNALDGDGRDNDPLDVFPGGGYHGSHVAGTIGAASDNGVGVAGVDWQARLVNVRVLGQQGGTLVDIYEALRWAAGFSVAGVPSNANPADVINLSLGGVGPCMPAMQEALNAVSQQAIVVVAAGNANVNVSQSWPASCSGVITVSATDRLGERAYYANYGSRIDVMAPGGAMGSISDPDGVLSIGYDATSGQFGYSYMQGTSMAAPHVTGVVALMKAIDHTIDTAGALEALRASATQLDSLACHGYGVDESRLLGPDDCGAGLIDAALALAYVGTGPGPGPGPGGEPLAFDPTVLDMGSAIIEMPFTITNVSASPLSWSLVFYEAAVDNPAIIPEGAFYIPLAYPDEGMLQPGESVVTALEIDREVLTVDGNYQIRLIFDLGAGEEQMLLVRFSRISGGAPGLTGPTYVESYVYDSFGDLDLSGQQWSGGVLSSFSFDAEPGVTIIGAWLDENDSGTIDEGDYLGFHPQTVNVRVGRSYDLPITIDRVISGSATAWPESWLRAMEAAAKP